MIKYIHDRWLNKQVDCIAIKHKGEWQYFKWYCRGEEPDKHKDNDIKERVE